MKSTTRSHRANRHVYVVSEAERYSQRVENKSRSLATLGMTVPFVFLLTPDCWLLTPNKTP